MVHNKDGSPKAKTSHTLNPVPCIFYDNTSNKTLYSLKKSLDENGKAIFGLSNIAASVVKLMDIEKPEAWDEAVIE